MFRSLAQHDPHRVISLWRTFHWTVLVTLVIVLIGVLCIGVQVAE